MSDSTAPIISIRGLAKTYQGGHEALKGIDLDIQRGEILALLGPNGAGKTSLISIICGLVNPSAGTVTVDGHDIISDFRKTRELIGLVPQELTLGAFDLVANSIKFSRGLFGKAADESFIDKLLSDLSLGDKKNAMVQQLSGGMKRRVLIAKALAHEPRILFLDEPTAGVDVELRKDMWALVEKLRADGVTIVLTTHYIEEAEEIADRVGVISDGRLLVIDDKENLMRSLGKKQLVVDLRESVDVLPASLATFDLELSDDGQRITYTFDTDLQTTQSSLEDIFVNLVQAQS